MMGDPRLDSVGPNNHCTAKLSSAPASPLGAKFDKAEDATRQFTRCNLRDIFLRRANWREKRPDSPPCNNNKSSAESNKHFTVFTRNNIRDKSTASCCDSTSKSAAEDDHQRRVIIRAKSNEDNGASDAGFNGKSGNNGKIEPITDSVKGNWANVDGGGGSGEWIAWRDASDHKQAKNNNGDERLSGLMPLRSDSPYPGINHSSAEPLRSSSGGDYSGHRSSLCDSLGSDGGRRQQPPPDESTTKQFSNVAVHQKKSNFSSDFVASTTNKTSSSVRDSGEAKIDKSNFKRSKRSSNVIDECKNCGKPRYTVEGFVDNNLRNDPYLSDGIETPDVEEELAKKFLFDAKQCDNNPIIATLLYRSRSLPQLFGNHDSGVGSVQSEQAPDKSVRQPVRLVSDLRQLLTIKQHYYPEGGWGYVIVLVSVLVQILSNGLHGALGVVLVCVSAKYGPNVYLETGLFWCSTK